MDVFEAIEKRHSYRGEFINEKVSRSHLAKIVQAGIRAPSGCNAQTTSFVIVDEPALIGRIGEIVGKPVVRNAQAIIVCIAEHRPVYETFSFGIEDCSAAVENMLLAVTAMDYATVWIDGALRKENRAARIAELLAVPKDKEVRVLLPLGVPKDRLAQRERRPFAERAWFNKYGAAE